MSKPSRFVAGAGTTISQCASCIHKHATGATCDAFPTGIPDAILLNRSDHREPYEGDSGIRYEPDVQGAT